MARFVAWFNATGPGAAKPTPALARSGLAHLYFVSVHPYEDGNGRIARALSEKALAQAIGHPSLVALRSDRSSVREFPAQGSPIVATAAC